MPPENDLILKFLLGFTAAGLTVLVVLLWNTRESVQGIHATITNKRSGFEAMWAAIDGILTRLTTLERERHASSPPDE